MKKILSEYVKKRNFKKTSEPKPSLSSKHKKLIYVIQKHDARRLHFDFRLELKGVLKSWAVPKGMPVNPKDKRLAVMTEDHPLAYANFEGRIPEGQYGAGTVEIWDKGNYVNITVKNEKLKDLENAITEGHFTIYLKGEKLEGTYSFTKLKDKNWIVVKKQEENEKTQLKNSTISIENKKIELTNLNKKIDELISKKQLIDYYTKIAKVMLPHVKDRLISMYRFPDGVQGKKFFQKDAPGYFPKWLKCKIVESEDNKKTCYTVVEDKAGIVYLANQVVEPHIMTSREDKPDIPDKIVFDFDPSELDLPKLKKMLQITKKFLESVGLTPFIMTTGGKGYHISAPVKRELTNTEVRAFALTISTTLADTYPNIFTTELSKKKRNGLIFIDVNRNSPMQLVIAPYTVRAKPKLTIASPFEWNELPDINPDSFSIKNPPTGDPWRNFFKKSVSLKQVIKNITKP